MKRRRVLAALVGLSLIFASAGFAYADTTLDQVFSQLEQMYGLPSGILAKIANVESNGNATVCASTSSACGMFQWTIPSWEEITKKVFGTAYSPLQRSNPTLSAKMTAIALRQSENANGALIRQAQIDMSLGLYMCHFLGSTGCGHFFQDYLQDPNASASALFPKEAASNASIFGGRTLSGVLTLLAGRMSVASPSVNVAGNFTDQSGLSLAYSFADVSSNNFLPANFTPPATDPNYTYPTNYFTMSQMPSTGLIAPTQIGQPALVSQAAPAPIAQTPQAAPQSTPIAQTPPPASQQAAQSSGAQSSGAAVPPVSLIIVQPSSVKLGDPLVVSWVSVGMSGNACQAQEGSTMLAQGDQGSQIINTSTMSAGTNTFTLSCTASGQTIEHSVSVTVQ